MSASGSRPARSIADPKSHATTQAFDPLDRLMMAFPETARVLKDGRYCVLFRSRAAIAQFSAAWERAGLRTVGQIVWRKSHASGRRHTECRHESGFPLAKGRPARPAMPLGDMREWEYSGNRHHHSRTLERH